MTLEEGGGGWELYVGVGEGGHWGISWGDWTGQHPNSGSPKQCVHEYLAVPGHLPIASVDTAGVQGLLPKPDRRPGVSQLPVWDLDENRDPLPRGLGQPGQTRRPKGSTEAQQE